MWLTDWIKWGVNSLSNPTNDELPTASSHNGLPLYSAENLDTAVVALRASNGEIYAYREVQAPRQQHTDKRPRSSSSSRSRSRSRTRTRHRPSAQDTTQEHRVPPPKRAHYPTPAPAPAPAHPTPNAAPDGRPFVGKPPAAAFSSPPVTASSWDTTALARMVEMYGWDHWPDGPWSHTYQREMGAEFAFRVHWAFETRGARGPSGSPTAARWQDGKCTERRCLGHIACTNTPECVYVGRPKTRAAMRRAQEEQGCPNCGKGVTLVPCSVVSRYWIFAGGAHYDNGDGPVKLMTGPQRAGGPGPSVIKISTLLMNPRRVAFEKRKALEPEIVTTKDDHFYPALQQLREEHPDWTVDVHWTSTARVICLQSPFMRRSCVRDLVDDEALNGIVTDAAHKFFKGPNSILIASSVFEHKFLRCYVPVVLSFSDGGTALHYSFHFRRLFQGIAEQCEAEGIPVTDELFANVVDFSQAQRLGFVMAFVEYWESVPGSTRDRDALIKAASGLLRGCERHYREQINRVKKISKIVEPAQQHLFENYALQLLQAKSVEELVEIARKFLIAFPGASGWIRWWLAPHIAQMLFESVSTMSPQNRAKLEATTNAAEAMNSRLYDMVEMQNPLFPGLRGLIRAVSIFESQYHARQQGVANFYGHDRRDWQRIADVYGYTHHTRHTPKPPTTVQHDSRPPDTIERLTKASEALIRKPAKRARTTAAQTNTVMEYQPWWHWERHSCAMDASLAVLSAAAKHDHDGIQRILSAVHPENPLAWVLTIFEIHRKYEATTSTVGDIHAELKKARNELRTQLAHSKFCSEIKSDSRPMSMFGWLYSIASRNGAPGDRAARDRGMAAFLFFGIPVNRCFGDGTETHGHAHWELSRPHFGKQIQLPEDSLKKFDGKLSKWFKSLLDTKNNWRSLPRCYRSQAEHAFCAGKASSHYFIIHIPLILIIELGATAGVKPGWSIPDKLQPLPGAQAVSSGVQYQIVGHIYSDEPAINAVGMGIPHFIARYSLPDGRVFQYDGMRLNGHAYHSADMGIHWMTGRSDKLPSLPDGFTLYAVVYQLEGGEAAQEVFRTMRQDKGPSGARYLRGDDDEYYLGSAYIERPNFIPLSRLERTWISSGATTHLRTSHEYRVDPSVSPRKRKAKRRATPSDSDSDDSDSESGGDANDRCGKIDGEDGGRKQDCISSS
ncbi:hypothetical protein C8F01DRAFT_1342824 [Mycena amicta]|nr:hypothetical protein C8F01DRAFT_1342824 [Mycena amicta]